MTKEKAEQPTDARREGSDGQAGQPTAEQRAEHARRLKQAQHQEIQGSATDLMLPAHLRGNQAKFELIDHAKGDNLSLAHKDTTHKGDSHGHKLSPLAKLRHEIEENANAIVNSAATIGDKMFGLARELGRDPERWKSSTTGKCNLLVGECISRCAGAPWQGPIPDCAGIDSALGHSKDWQVVWSARGKDFDTSLKEFQKFKGGEGDVVLWNNKTHQHTGILDSDNIIYYAGSRRSPTGYDHLPISYYTGTPSNPMDYGAPTVIYRHVRAQSTK